MWLIRTLIPFMALILQILLPNTAAALEAPPLKGRINDYAAMLTPATAQTLERRLAAFEQETTTQIVLLTVQSLEGDTIEGFSIRVGESWKIGQKGKDNGVLLILAKKERKIRIEVGKGLQGALPDITAAQIIRTVIAPKLRAGELDQGISAGLAAIMDAVKGEFKATPADRKAKKSKGSSSGLFLMLLLGALLVTAMAGAASRTAGTLAGGISLPAAAGIGLGLGMAKLGLLALLGGVAGFLLSLLIRLFGGSGGGGSYGGGWGGPTIFYGGGGSSSGSDSFDGGGGDFDGGGSSDDW